MGVGGDDSWGAKPHKKYTLYPKKYSIEFLLIPFEKGDNLREVSKISF